MLIGLRISPMKQANGPQKHFVNMATEKLNIIPHQHTVSKADRMHQKQHRSAILWFVGLSGSGKSTLANMLEAALHERGIHTYLLDGDNIRAGLNKGLTFSAEDRQENIRRIGEVAKLFVDAGTVVLTAFISPFKSDRKRVRDLVGEGEFIEVFVDCPLEVCEQRDVKGLYAKARRGEISHFTGISSPFEAPEAPEVRIPSAELNHQEALAQLLEAVLPRLALPNPTA